MFDFHLNHQTQPRYFTCSLKPGYPPPYGSNRPKRAYSSVFLKAQRFERSMDKIPNEQEQSNTTPDASDSRYKN